MPNGYRIFCLYPSPPSSNPEAGLSLDSVCDSPGLALPLPAPVPLVAALARAAVPASVCDSPILPDIETTPTPSSAAPAQAAVLASSTPPFANWSSKLLLGWHFSGSTVKSVGEFDRLVEILSHPEFDLKELLGVSFTCETKRLAKHLANPESKLQNQDGWHCASVDIRLPPVGKQTVKPESESLVFMVSGIYHRRLVDIIQATYAAPVSHTFHMTLFRQYWRPTSDAPPILLYSEVYSSPGMIEAHLEITSMPRMGLDNTHERIVAPLMVWSDSTHLASFGTASLLLFYLLFGSQSKYTRARPTSKSAHHLAYIPTIPDTIQEAYMKVFGKAATSAMLRHCKRDLIHAIWLLLLDANFMEAYEHGMLIKCGDGIVRRIFPWFLTYSADYPEKVLLASIRSLAKCLCPRCLVEKNQVYKIGSKLDMRLHKKMARQDDAPRRHAVEVARKIIYKQGYGIESTAVDALLADKSWVPTWVSQLYCTPDRVTNLRIDTWQNAFSMKLSKYGFNFYDLFVVDLLHEFELGVWKAIFTHLLRILWAAAGTKYRN
ncbi:hypothetical protein HETIRDRAFT_328118 [Heterobasidion irregulare TC 32-1]|uniref:Uncharacterized protein n=1 Tax=Heterobasidion irregulare (strain TC 32-1) TaxID=747525 RepID=W4JTL9_HETIT|nr:uncharacterized protein HETIRDRAFT_328118 [Heterobasidion irregulare TC 32-1]ETW76907.1 hypothetical protein HETIRDRAFT_328118 [Heterobasidion irregulare TC 32-1]